VARRGFITQIYPRLRWATTAVARDRLLRRTPGQPYRIHGHTKTNAPLTHQRLILRRETLVNVWVLRDARPRSSTAGEKDSGCSFPDDRGDVSKFPRLFKNLDEISKTPVRHWFRVLRHRFVRW